MAQLYVYDLSRGMAKAMSLGLTGKQIDGIWHTSVVVFGREIFYGRGIMEAAPGTTHHGQPDQILEVGETHIDPDTFQEYLLSLQELYTSDAYHLIDFNCNNFTADVVGFMTGAEIPSWISGLPAEFLTTPLGQALKPQIDAMFGASSASEHAIARSAPATSTAAAAAAPPPSASPAPPANHNLAASFLQAMAAATAGGGANLGTANPAGAPATSAPSNPVTSVLLLVSSQANFDSILANNRAVVVNFTNTAGCPPCRVIKPVYESLAAEYHTKFGPKGTRFLEVEMGVGEGHDIASKHGVSATPTFIFYKDGAKVGEVCGADKRGIEGATQRLLADCFQHAHERMYLPATSRLSVQPITATATPAFAALMGKLEGFAGASSPDVAVLKADVIPLLEGKSAANAAVIDKWTTTTTSLLEKLNPAAVFPVIDLWRLGLLNNTVVAQLVARLSSGGAQPLSAVLSLTARALKADIAGAPRPLLLTALRLTTNLLSPLPLANVILGAQSELQTDLFAVLVDALLHPEISVRKAAADVAVNAAAWRHRVAKACEAAGGASDEDGLEAEWEVELLTALLEGIGREADPDVGHRLLAATALLMYLSPAYAGTLHPLLQVLEARTTLQEAGKRWGNKDARKLADEVAAKLC